MSRRQQTGLRRRRTNVPRPAGSAACDTDDSIEMLPLGQYVAAPGDKATTTTPARQVLRAANKSKMSPIPGRTQPADSPSSSFRHDSGLSPATMRITPKRGGSRRRVGMPSRRSRLGSTSQSSSSGRSEHLASGLTSMWGSVLDFLRNAVHIITEPAELDEPIPNKEKYKYLEQENFAPPIDSPIKPLASPIKPIPGGTQTQDEEEKRKLKRQRLREVYYRSPLSPQSRIRRNRQRHREEEMRDPLGAWALVKGVVSAASPLVSRQARRRSSAGSRMQLAVEASRDRMKSLVNEFGNPESPLLPASPPAKSPNTERVDSLFQELVCTPPSASGPTAAGSKPCIFASSRLASVGSPLCPSGKNDTMTASKLIAAASATTSTAAAVMNSSALAGPSGAAPPPPPPPPALLRSKPAVKEVAALNSMQQRLRQRMTKTAAAHGDTAAAGDAAPGEQKIDPKMEQWLAIQSRTRKMSKEEFAQLAEQKRKEVERTISKLDQSNPSTMEEVEELLSSLDGAAQWFMGANKEMRTSIPLWSKVEGKVDTMLECFQISKSIATDVNEPIPQFDDLEQELRRNYEDFQARLRLWGPILKDNASSWRQAGLPVDEALLAKADGRLQEYPQAFATRAVIELASMYRTGFRNHWAKQLKKILYQAIGMIKEAASTTPRPSEDLLRSCGLCVEKYISLSNGMFDQFVHKQARVAVCSHFEDILRVMREFKDIAQLIKRARTAPTHIKPVRLMAVAAGTVPPPPPPPMGLASPSPKATDCAAADLIEKDFKLRTAIHEACRLLMEHIMASSQSVMADIQITADGSREVVLWLMFGCKFTNRVLEMLGPERVANDKQMQEVLQSLQQLEIALPSEC